MVGLLPAKWFLRVYFQALLGHDTNKLPPFKNIYTCISQNGYRMLIFFNMFYVSTTTNVSERLWRLGFFFQFLNIFAEVLPVDSAVFYWFNI